MRIASADDLDALVRLEWHAFGGDAWSLESMRGLFDDATLILVEPDVEPEDDGETPDLLAYAAFRSVVDEAELLRVAVRPEARRRGLGKALLVRGCTELRAGGVEVCHLEVRSDNAAARGLYSALGFECVGARPKYYRDGCDAELWMLTFSDVNDDVECA